jgi:hypothetical protein
MAVSHVRCTLLPARRNEPYGVSPLECLQDGDIMNADDAESCVYPKVLQDARDNFSARTISRNV